jgi:hypothetical protein
MTAALKLGLCAWTRGKIHVASMTEALPSSMLLDSRRLIIFVDESVPPKTHDTRRLFVFVDNAARSSDSEI